MGVASLINKNVSEADTGAMVLVKFKTRSICRFIKKKICTFSLLVSN